MKLVENQEQRYKLIVNILVLGISLFGILGQNLDYNRASRFETIMIDSMAPMQEKVTAFSSQIFSFFEHYVNNLNASRDNVYLRKVVAEYQDKIFQYQELAKENQRLKNLMQFTENIPAKRILAQIVAWDSSSDYRALRLNKGALDGIKLQSAVITSDGVVGYIYRLTDHFADVLTILDPNNRVDGLITRTRTHGIIEGLSNDRALMKYVSRTEQVILDDLVITSGLGNIYPKGVPVGTISKIERESYGITQVIEITPSVDFDKLEEVIILVSDIHSQHKEEWNALDNPEMNEGQNGGK